MPKQERPPLDTQRLKSARMGANLTQQGLAVKLGLHAVTVAKWETGMHRPSDLVMRSLARELGVTKAFLQGENEEVLLQKANGPEQSAETNPTFRKSGDESTQMGFTVDQVFQAITLVESAMGRSDSSIAEAVRTLLPVMK